MKNRVMTLGEISVFIRNGATIKQNNQEKNGYPITRIETISDGTIDQNRMGYAGIFEKEKYRNWFLENEDILISHINSEKHLGKSAIYFGDKEKIIHGMNLLCFRTKKEIVISSYLYFYFKSLKYKKNIGKIAKKSVNQASFSIKDFRDIEINLPDIENQKKIVEKLKTIYEILKLKEEQVKKLSELSKCLFFEMIKNSGKVLLAEVAEINMGQSPDSIFYNSEKKGIPFFQGKTEFGENYIKEIKYYCSSPIKIAEENSILMSVRAPVGTVNITDVKCCIGRGLASIKNKNIDMLYLFYALKNLEKEIEKKGVGSTFKAITKKVIEKIEIPVVSLEEQNKFAERIKLIEKSKFEIQQSIDETQKLFDSLMEKYFG